MEYMDPCFDSCGKLNNFQHQQDCLLSGGVDSTVLGGSKQNLNEIHRSFSQTCGANSPKDMRRAVGVTLCPRLSPLPP